MAEPRFRVAPLSSEDLTVTEAMKILAEWMVSGPEAGAPAITVSKRDSGVRTVAQYLADPCDTCGHTLAEHNSSGCMFASDAVMFCICGSFQAAD